MHLPAPTETDFEIAPAGTHLAVCYRVIDLGTQAGSFQGQPKSQHKILLSWELPEERMKDNRPFTISQRYTWSMSEKATLRKHLEGWRGRGFTEADFGPNGFNIKNVIGKGCVLTVMHATKGEKTYANIAAVGKLMKGMEAPAPTNETAYLWIDESIWDSSVFHKLSQGMQAVIVQSPEYRKMINGHDEPDAPDADHHHGSSAHPAFDDEIPF